MSGDGAFDARAIAAADAQRLAGGVHAFDAGMQLRVHRHARMRAAAPQPAAEQLRQLHVRHQSVADRQLVAVDAAAAARAVDLHRLQLAVAMRRQHHAAAVIGNAGQLRAQAQRLQRLVRPAPRQLRGEAGQIAQRGLFDDAQHLRAVAAQRRRAGQQQRAAAGHQYALAGQRPALLGQRLRAAGAGDAGQGPAGERQQQFARAGGQHQCVVTDPARALRAIGQQLSVLRHQQLGLRQKFDLARRQLRQHARGQLRRRMGHIVTPDLAAGARLQIDQGHAPTMPSRGQRRRQSGRTGTGHDHVVVQRARLRHRSTPACRRAPG